MGPMSDFDYLTLDGRSLRLFLTVLESGSVTAAAERLGITQSAVSHSLDKLRTITGDPLFVKAGRGIVATAHAEALGERARGVLDGMKGLAQGPGFDPARSRREFTIAANDYQRDLLLPRTLQTVQAEAPRVRLRIIPAGMPTVELLREGRCDLIVAPEPPTGPDILDSQLLEDRLVCFFDPSRRSAPADMEQYLGARHIGLRFDDSEKADFEQRFRAMGIHRQVAVVVDNVAGIPAFMRGTELLAIGPRLLERSMMREFAWTEPPFPTPPLHVHMAWHRRYDEDPAHRWLRRAVERATARVKSR